MQSEQDQRDGDDMNDCSVSRESEPNTSRSRALAALRYVLSPYSTARLAGRMCLLLLAWIFVACTYYGISLNANNVKYNARQRLLPSLPSLSSTTSRTD